MKIIGISGLENSVPFRKAHRPGLDEREYRMVPGQNAAAALVVDGRLVAAAQQERFNRKKHSGDFPIDAIEYCLAQAGVSIHEIDEVAHGFDFAPFRDAYTGNEFSTELYNKVLSREALLVQMRRELPSFKLENVHQVNHHLAHAASAAYTSGWDECLVAVIDSLGEMESTSVYNFREGALQKLHTISSEDSIGILYSLVAFHLGFNFTVDEHQVAAMAPYGDPTRYRKFFEDAVELCPDGCIRIPMLQLNQSCEEREDFSATRAFLHQHLMPRRAPGEPVTSDHHDAAAALQECLERAVAHICEHFGKATGHRRLALAGTISLDCPATRLDRSPLFDEIYVAPVAGDDGTALGAALYRTSLAMKIPNERFAVPYFGPRLKVADIESTLYRCNGRIRYERYASVAETCNAAAKLIGEGHVIAWSRGRMEYGPNALGNRSILADPGNPEMRGRINALLKKGEFSCPPAPACAAEEAHRWFEMEPGREFPYMNGAVNVRPEVREQLPAVTQTDGSACLQTVNAKDNPDFHALLVAVGRRTGCPMVLNTGFCLGGQPIANTPEEAIVTFLNSGVEHLFLENYHVTRSGKQPNRIEVNPPGATEKIGA